MDALSMQRAVSDLFEFAHNILNWSENIVCIMPYINMKLCTYLIENVKLAPFLFLVLYE